MKFQNWHFSKKDLMVLRPRKDIQQKEAIY